VTAYPAPDFRHLLAMTDVRGTFEHARFAVPRPEHGYCTDDMARVLVVAAREPVPMAGVRDLVRLSLRFLSRAQSLEGAYRNRLGPSGRWLDRPALEDSWGRSIWGLGTAAGSSGTDWVRQTATSELERAAHRRSRWPRAMAFAAIGAAELLTADPGNPTARALLADAADEMAAPNGDAAWPWPETRLAYANAVLPEAMIAAGTVLGRDELVDRGLELLGWLLERETRDGHLSVTAVGGGGRGDVGPRFDQQPIEVATLADACARAATVDDSSRWANGIAAAVAWFLGDNDAQQVMWDPTTGGGYDGLEVDGPNLNQGTESTLALLSTLQHARHLVAVPA
jgi:hypothetical protein